MPEERERGALLIAACLIAAIRLRGEPIQPSPKLKATIYDSVQLQCWSGGRYRDAESASKLTFARENFDG